MRSYQFWYHYFVMIMTMTTKMMIKENAKIILKLAAVNIIYELIIIITGILLGSLKIVWRIWVKIIKEDTIKIRNKIFNISTKNSKIVKIIKINAKCSRILRIIWKILVIFKLKFSYKKLYQYAN